MSALPARRAVLLVARREFVGQVRSRSFLVGLVVTFAFFAGLFLLGAYVDGQTSSSALGVTTQAAALRPALADAARERGVELTLPAVSGPAGRAQVAAGELDALLTGAPGDLRLVGLDTVDDGLRTLVEDAARAQAAAAALAGAGVDPAVLTERARLAVATLQPTDPATGQRLGLALVGTLLLFFSLSNHGQLVATGVVEEKQSRVVELLLATITPGRLLAGKILGLGAVGLLQLVVLGAVGALGATAAGLLTLPAAAAGMFVTVIGWYLLGFFLFAALYAAVASTVSRQEELNPLVAPLIILLLVPFVLTLNLLPSDPRNELAAVLSFVPFFAQTVMPARYALGVASLTDMLVAGLLTLLTIAVVVRLSARIYRNSVLRTGARVGWREALGTRRELRPSRRASSGSTR